MRKTENKITYIKIPGDDNCGFHCISLYLLVKRRRLSRNEKDNVRFLRNQLIQYYANPPISSPISKEEINERLRSLLRSKDEWLTDTDLRVFSSIFRVKFKVKVYESEFQLIDYQSFHMEQTAFHDISKDTCYLLFRDSNHYDLIFPFELEEEDILDDYRFERINSYDENMTQYYHMIAI